MDSGCLLFFSSSYLPIKIYLSRVLGPQGSALCKWPSWLLPRSLAQQTTPRAAHDTLVTTLGVILASFLIPFPSVLVSCGGCNKFPQTGWLTDQNAGLSQSGDQKSEIQILIELGPPRGSWENASHASLLASHGHWHPLTCRHIS